MTKIEFKNLPDTTTPLSADNLNLLQDNVEDAIDGKVSKSGDTMSGNLSITGDMTSTIFQGNTWDYYTENTIDTWVPVSTGDGKWQHRIVPTKLSEKLDTYEDSFGNDIYALLNAKLNLVSTKLSGVTNGTMFLNGGWSGTDYGFGIGSKIDNVIQVTMFFSDGIYFARLSNNQYKYRKVAFQNL